MRTNYFTRIIFILMMIPGLSSCEKFLDNAPMSEATSGNAYRTASDLDAALVGAYQTFYTEYFIWEYFVVSDVRSDNAYAGGDADEIYQYDDLDISPLNSRILGTWQQLYNGISRANLVIGKATEVQDPALDVNNRREYLIAEAKFLRALFYYELVRQFREVPIVTAYAKINPEEANIKKSTELEVYNFIVKDLEEATILPATYSSSSLSQSKATKGAVYALLAKVWAQRPDRDYNKVLQYTDEVERLGYDLHGSFDELFDGTHYDNKETILLIQFKEGTNQSNWGPQMLLPSSLSGDDWRKYITPSKDLVKAFDDAGDHIRKDASILFDDAGWSDEFWKPCPTTGEIPFAYKFRHASGWMSGDHIYILRFDDILLLKAEALNALGRSGEALAPLNKIRDRVDLPALDIQNKDALLLAILNERRLEFAFEGDRWYSLQRTGMLQSTMDNLKEYRLICGGNGTLMNYGMNDNRVWLPIPQSELNRNPNLVQNPGY
ncbi:RagB/SusD family nutrient uptake outer membrane protein [Sphingobacterium spiritivorum]|uniref:RagB/SusD family nutrient uptake outer membrane protein n=1 Tax=Sphingobacterium spiritivorum TaxID=258 RepID=UPI003DA40213